MTPLAANIVGFLLSFAWCFFGHARWTFPAEGRDVGIALQRFAVVSLLSFALTQAAYAVLLSGPSGSADIGGVTVHPAQGVTTLTVVLGPGSRLATERDT